MFKIGQSWEHEWLITDELYKKFLDLSKDNNPMHTNPLFAKENGFEDKIVHGNLLNCFISFFVGEMLPSKNVVIIGQQIKFINPFYINEEIRLNARLSKYNVAVSFLEFEICFEKKDLIVAEGNIQLKIL